MTNYIISEILNKVSHTGNIAEVKKTLAELKEAKTVLDASIKRFKELIDENK